MTQNAPDPTADKAPQAHPGLPRWARRLAWGVAVAVVVLVMVMLLVGGEHGPGMHG
ncbi:hypothetical protein C8K30_108155 [Promicromonospora sp. AC04]|uniref:hypothetical protein n=1 Tax=Promicromonospora sp. AC04 TaxID=2135723 RepID=UPI000D4A60F7|nr:hypothetical protein [Promicromonospora sp. AC04]PUB24898.1 hypothetical protein C8K30_108155 [Promicromonospora sp. AC04]